MRVEGTSSGVQLVVELIPMCVWEISQLRCQWFALQSQDSSLITGLWKGVKRSSFVLRTCAVRELCAFYLGSTQQKHTMASWLLTLKSMEV